MSTSLEQITFLILSSDSKRKIKFGCLPYLNLLIHSLTIAPTKFNEIVIRTLTIVDPKNSFFNVKLKGKT